MEMLTAVATDRPMMDGVDWAVTSTSCPPVVTVAPLMNAWTVSLTVLVAAETPADAPTRPTDREPLPTFELMLGLSFAVTSTPSPELVPFASTMTPFWIAAVIVLVIVLVEAAPDAATATLASETATLAATATLTALMVATEVALTETPPLEVTWVVSALPLESPMKASMVLVIEFVASEAPAARLNAAEPADTARLPAPQLEFVVDVSAALDVDRIRLGSGGDDGAAVFNV